METKTISFELKDMSTGKREVVFAHAVYGNIDTYGDVSNKGMFNKSWKENKSNIQFHINHSENSKPGSTSNVWEDDQKAYTQAKFDDTKEGSDAMDMIDSGLITTASFGYSTVRREYKSVMNRKIRNLKEVKHYESSLLTYDKNAANPLAGIVSFTKGGDEIKNFLGELKEKIDQLEIFCRNTKASDDCILSILNEVDELKSIFSKYESFTYAADKAPTPELEFAEQISLLTLKHF